MFVELIMGVICFVPNIFLQQSKPPTPPSFSAVAKRDTFKQAINSLVKNKDYILLLFAFGCYFGIFNGISIILSYLLNPWFKDSLAAAVGYVGGSPIVSGIIGVIIIGRMQRKSRKFKKYIIICMIGNVDIMQALVQLWYYFILFYRQTYLLWSALFLLTTHFS